MLVKIGTRRSPLAIAQTNYIASLIKAKHPEILNTIRTEREISKATEAKLHDVMGAFSKAFA